MIKPYQAALIQQEAHVIVDPADRDDVIDRNLSRIFELPQWTFNLNTVHTGPGDVYTEYTERYGELSMFPVVDTEIGELVGDGRLKQSGHDEAGASHG